MISKFKFNYKEMSELEIAIIIAIIVGICIAVAIIVLEIRTERFSAIYITPDSYSNFPDGDTVSFTYGIRSFEKQRLGYSIKFYVNNVKMSEKTVELSPGEVFEEKKIIKLPANIIYPAKIRIISTYANDQNEVHYWLKNK